MEYRNIEYRSIEYRSIDYRNMKNRSIEYRNIFYNTVSNISAVRVLCWDNCLLGLLKRLEARASVLSFNKIKLSQQRTLTADEKDNVIEVYRVW